MGIAGKDCNCLQKFKSDTTLQINSPQFRQSFDSEHFESCWNPTKLRQKISEFGKEFDSLSDVICFGLAPALILFDWALQGVGKIGWLCAFVYVAATALRLARFNTYTATEPGYFQGLPCPLSAAFIITWMWVAHDAGFRESQVVVTVSTVLISAVALCMVNSLPYLSFKNLNLKGRIPFIAAIAMVFGFALISFNPPRELFLMFFAYALSGQPCG